MNITLSISINRKEIVAKTFILAELLFSMLQTPIAINNGKNIKTNPPNAKSNSLSLRQKEYVPYANKAEIQIAIKP